MAHYSPPPDSNDSDCITITIKKLKKKIKIHQQQKPINYFIQVKNNITI
jgi:hypothetical protein